MRLDLLKTTLLALLLSNPLPADEDPLVDRAITAMLTMHRLAWEHATAALSLYEYGRTDLAELMALESALRQEPSGAYFEGYPTDTCAMGEVMVRVASKTGDASIRQAIRNNRDYMRNVLRRADDGMLIHTPEANEVWIDSMFMAPPVLAAMGDYDDAVNQVRGLHRRLWDNDAHLFHHQYSEDTRSIKGSKLWGVGNGWALMGMIRTARLLPDGYAREKKEIIEYYRAALDGCLATVRPDGLTHFILTDPSTFVDSGAAPTFAYSIYRGIQYGWIPMEGYLEKAEFMRKAVRAKVDEHGFLQDACGVPNWESQSRSVETQSFLILMEAARKDLLGDGQIILQDEEPLAAVIARAPAGSVVACDPAREQVISRTIVINKPLTLSGLRARLPAGLGKTPMIEVASENVVLMKLHLTGNSETVSQDNRAPLIDVHKGNFRIQECVFENSSKDGVMINARANSGDLVGVVVRDIVGRGNVRDVVSISGDGQTGGKVRNVLVENIRGYDSSLRGPVEVSDGSENVTVRSVYAENCIYGVDVQDHNSAHQVNRNILIEDVYARNSKHAIRMANHDHGHADLTIRNVTAVGCKLSLQAKNTTRILIENVRIIDPAGESPQLDIRNCTSLVVQNIFLPDSCRTIEDCLLVENCTNVRLEGILLAQPSSPNP